MSHVSEVFQKEGVGAPLMSVLVRGASAAPYGFEVYQGLGHKGTTL